MTDISEGEIEALYELIKLGHEASGSSEAIKAYFDQVQSRLSDRLPIVQFPSHCDWFNSSRPWTCDDLRGQVTLLDFWTYCCINCMHILPDLEAVEETFKNVNLVTILGVHSAKFDNEKLGQNICDAINRYGIAHPVINDAQAVLWKHLCISCWPTVVLLGPDVKPLKFFIGEGHRESMIAYIKVALEYFKPSFSSNGDNLPTIQVGTHALETALRYPGKVLVQADHVFISDTGNHRVVICDRVGKVERVIGGVNRGHVDGTFGEAKFDSPQGLAFASNCLYVCDTSNNVIRCIDLDQGLVSTIVGNGNSNRTGLVPSSPIAGLDAAISSPWDVSYHDHRLFIALAGNHQICKYDLTTKKLELIAGCGKEENRNTSYPFKASFAQPSGLCLGDDNKCIYIADSESSSVRVYSLDKPAVKNVCGGSRDPMDLFSYGDKDGKGVEAKLQHPLGVAFDSVKSKLYIADSYNHKLKMVQDLHAKQPECLSIPLSGLREPGGLCFDAETGALYVADTNNHTIKVVNTETFEAVELVLEMPSPASSGEVDFSSCQVIQVSKKDLKVRLRISNGYHLNLMAPNGYKVDLGTDIHKGEIGENLEFELHMMSEDSANCVLKLYLCSNATNVCIVKSKKVIFQFSPHASEDIITIDV